MWYSLLFFTFITLFFIQLPYSKGKVYEGEILATLDEFVELTSFYYGTNVATDGSVGSLSVDLYNYDPSITIAIYNDQPFSWPNITQNEDNCTFLTSLHDDRHHPHNPAIFIRSGDQLPSFTIQIPASSIPRQWYIAAVHCDSHVGHATFHISMLNHGGWWTRQFSWDHRGILQVYLIFFLCFTLLWIIYAWYVIWPLKQARAIFPIVKLLSASLGTAWACLCFGMIHLSLFASDGIGSPGAEILSSFSSIISQLLFMILIILIAKGWVIHVPYIPERRQVGFFMGLYILQFFVLILWDMAKNGRTPIHHVFSPQMLFILFLRFVLFAWFLVSVIQTYRTVTGDHMRQHFYLKFGLVFSVWFLSFPFILLLLTAMHPWVRIPVVIALDSLVDLSAYTVFVSIVWPSTLSKYQNRIGLNTTTQYTVEENSRDLPGGMAPYDAL